MTTQHRPSREHPGNEHRGTTVLEKFYSAVQTGNHEKINKLLTEIEKSPPVGLWMHRALALAFEGPREHLDKTLDILFESAHPPQPTEKSDFIRLALQVRPYDCLYRLLDLGFRPHAKTVTAMLERVRFDSTLDVLRIKPAHLMSAKKDVLVGACAHAVASNLPEQWLRTLNTVLPKPLPAAQITDSVMWQMVQKGGNMHTVSQESLNLARDLWWVDHNLAQLAYDKIAGSQGGSWPNYRPEIVALYAQALSMVAHSGIEEEPLPQPAASSSPRKRL